MCGHRLLALEDFLGVYKFMCFTKMFGLQLNIVSRYGKIEQPPIKFFILNGYRFKFGRLCQISFEIVDGTKMQ